MPDDGAPALQPPNVAERAQRGALYVPASEAAALQKAMEGYQLFIKLAEQYADGEIRLTRRETAKRKHPGRAKP